MGNPNHDPATGQFTSGVSAAGSEGHHRSAGRYPVTSHQGQRSVGSHSGKLTIVALDERTTRFEPVAHARRRSVAESILRGQRLDGKFSRIV